MDLDAENDACRLNLLSNDAFCGPCSAPHSSSNRQSLFTMSCMKVAKCRKGSLTAWQNSMPALHIYSIQISRHQCPYSCPPSTLDSQDTISCRRTWRTLYCQVRAFRDYHQCIGWILFPLMEVLFLFSEDCQRIASIVKSRLVWAALGREPDR